MMRAMMLRLGKILVGNYSARVLVGWRLPCIDLWGFLLGFDIIAVQKLLTILIGDLCIEEDC